MKIIKKVMLFTAVLGAFTAVASAANAGDRSDGVASGPTTYGDSLSPKDSAQIEMWVIDSPPKPPIGIERKIANSAMLSSAVMLPGVPTSTWTYGCSATSAGMMFGYYDRNGYPNMYTGPANGGVAPLTNLGQGINAPIAGACSIIATQDGFDGRVIKGHVDDYWTGYGNAGPDPFEGHWTQHTWGDCTADYMGTNQWKWDYSGDGSRDNNTDGSTILFFDNTGAKLYDYVPPESNGLPQTELCHGLRLFAESRGYTVLENYTQLIEMIVPGGFSLLNFQAEIDAGRPVMIQVEGHSMVGVGYEPGTQTIFLHDTWDNAVHTMTWGGSYSGMQHLAVTCIRLVSVAPQITGTSSIASEGCLPANNAIDPLEYVTLDIQLKNAGLATVNLVATLQPTGGVTLPTEPQTYGVLTDGGAGVTRSFSFLATGTCGGNLTVTLQLQDGATDLGTIALVHTLGVRQVSFTQKFDSVTAPALPSGWTATIGQGAITKWATSTVQRDTTPNAAFATDPAVTSDNYLISPSIAITTASARLIFRHNYALEGGYDGGVLEIAIGTGGYTDIITAGGSFSAGGYNEVISDVYENPIGGRNAWTGSSGGWITTTVNLPATAAGKNVRFCWRLGSDEMYGATGWYVDTITLEDEITCCHEIVDTRIISLSGNLAFGDVLIDSSKQKTLTISNIGNSTLTVSGINYPSGFSGNWSGAITAGGSQDVTVTFSPTTQTDYSGTVTVDSDKTSGTNTIQASGVGTVPAAPTAENQSVSTLVSTPSTVTLQATDEGVPNPPGALSYVIKSLPEHGTLSDPNGGPIAAADYTLANLGKEVIYTPVAGYLGPDAFTFLANDGGTAPTGGDSNTATVTISVVTCSTVAIGTGTTGWEFPMRTNFEDSRTQVIYLANEIGRSGDITSLALNVGTLPGQALNAWTIRMKHTPLSSYLTPALEAADWVVVYQGNYQPTTTGWCTVMFTNPFAYDGVQNLLIDFSHNNSYVSVNALCAASTPGGMRSAYATSNSSDGDPLDWTGTTSPNVLGSTTVPNVQFGLCGYFPPPPTGFTNTSQTTGSITWGWIDGSNNEDGFVGHGPTHATVWTVGADVVTITEEGLAVNTQYTRHVHAWNTNGYSEPTNSVSAYTSIEASTGVAFGTVGATSIQVKSANTPTNLAVAGSGLIIRNKTSGTDSGWRTNNNFWNNPSLTVNTPYSFTVQTRNGGGDLTAETEPAVKWTPALAPQATCTKPSNDPILPVGSVYAFNSSVVFGSGGVDHYHYAWNQSAAYAVSDSEPTTWNNGTLNLTGSEAGKWYLHLLSHNGEHVPGGSIHMGPYLVGYAVTTSASPAERGTTSGDGGYLGGESCTVSAFAGAGYALFNWTENGVPVSTSANYTFDVTSNRNLVANFAPIRAIAASAAPSAGGKTGGNGSYVSGLNCTVGAYANKGYTFTGWMENGVTVSTSALYTFTVEGNRTLVANFAPGYMVTASASPLAGGTVGGGGQYNSGQSCTVIASANAGYNFTAWTENGTQVSTSATYTFTVSGSRALVANFITSSTPSNPDLNYSISAASSPTAGGTVSGGGNYANGQSCTVNATPSSGFTFINWTEGGNVVSASASYTFNVSGDRALLANFTPSVTTTYTLRVENPSGESVPQTYAAGTSVPVTAPAAPEGQYFAYWSGDVSGQDNPITVVMDRDKNIRANYEDCNSQLPPCGTGTSVCGAVTLLMLGFMRLRRFTA